MGVWVILTATAGESREPDDAPQAQMTASIASPLTGADRRANDGGLYGCLGVWVIVTASRQASQ